MKKSSFYVWVFIFSIYFTGFVKKKQWAQDIFISPSRVNFVNPIDSIVTKIKTNQVTRPSDAAQIWIWLRSLIEANQHVRGHRMCAIKTRCTPVKSTTAVIRVHYPVPGPPMCGIANSLCGVDIQNYSEHLGHRHTLVPFFWRYVEL